MRSNGEYMPDSKIVEKIVRNLTEQFTDVVVSIEESNDTKNMNIDELQSSCLFMRRNLRKLAMEKKIKLSLYEAEA